MDCGCSDLTGSDGFDGGGCGFKISCIESEIFWKGPFVNPNKFSAKTITPKNIKIPKIHMKPLVIFFSQNLN